MGLKELNKTGITQDQLLEMLQTAQKRGEKCSELTAKELIEELITNIKKTYSTT